MVKCKSGKRSSANFCSFGESKSWFTSVLSDDFYRHSSYNVELKCKLWSEEGSFRAFLSTNQSTSPIIGSSAAVGVVNNKKFSVGSFFTAVLPCQPGEFGV